jgi:DNA-binding response OmpR family regulator
MGNVRKILVVDEDQEFVDGCHSTFNGNCYRVHSVSSKQQAREIIDGDFDLLIIGSLSPAGESFTLQQWVKQHPIYRHIPVLVIDAAFYERRRKGWRVFEGLRMDAEEYVSKPMRPVELLPLIEKLCANGGNGNRQAVETLWQAYLSLDEEGRDIFSNRILQLRK